MRKVICTILLLAFWALAPVSSAVNELQLEDYAPIVTQCNIALYSIMRYVVVDANEADSAKLKSLAPSFSKLISNFGKKLAKLQTVTLAQLQYRPHHRLFVKYYAELYRWSEKTGKVFRAGDSDELTQQVILAKYMLRNLSDILRAFTEAVEGDIGKESKHKDIVRPLKQTMARRHMVRGRTAVEIARTWQDYEIAIREFEQAAKFAPDWPEIYYNLGVVQEKAGQYGEAIGNLKKYLALAPDGRHAEQVRELIYKVEKEERELLNPNSLVGIWWPNLRTSDDDRAYRFEIRNNNGKVEARALAELFWEVHRPKGRFVPIQWDGKTLRISRAVYYGCTLSVRSDCCPCEATYNLIRVSVDKLEGEVEVSGIYESASGTKHFTFKYKLVWIRRK